MFFDAIFEKNYADFHHYQIKTTTDDYRKVKKSPNTVWAFFMRVG